MWSSSVTDLRTAWGCMKREKFIYYLSTISIWRNTPHHDISWTSRECKNLVCFTQRITHTAEAEVAAGSMRREVIAPADGSLLV